MRNGLIRLMRPWLKECKAILNRAKVSVEYPASFMLVASMNPCPCGYYNHPEKGCICGAGMVKSYVAKISSPLLDRLDLHLEVTPVSYDELSSLEKPKLTSAAIRARVLRAR